MQEITVIAKKYYQSYAPYQFLAYWFELWLGYERKVGKISPLWNLREFEQSDQAPVFE